MRGLDGRTRGSGRGVRELTSQPRYFPLLLSGSAERPAKAPEAVLNLVQAQGTVFLEGISGPCNYERACRSFFRNVPRPILPSCPAPRKWLRRGRRVVTFSHARAM